MLRTADLEVHKFCGTASLASKVISSRRRPSSYEQSAHYHYAIYVNSIVYVDISRRNSWTIIYLINEKRDVCHINIVALIMYNGSVV